MYFFPRGTNEFIDIYPICYIFAQYYLDLEQKKNEKFRLIIEIKRKLNTGFKIKRKDPLSKELQHIK